MSVLSMEARVLKIGSYEFSLVHVKHGHWEARVSCPSIDLVAAPVLDTTGSPICRSNKVDIVDYLCYAYAGKGPLA